MTEPENKSWYFTDAESPNLVLNNENGEAQTANLTRLYEADLPAVYRLHDLAHSLMPQPGLLAHETKNFFLSHTDEAGQLYGFFREKELIAYTVLGLPKGPGYNFGEQFGLPLEELGKVAHCDGSIVHPDWRGNHLQQRFIDWRIRIAMQHQREHILSTAAPLNPASWRNLIRSGFAIYKLLNMFGADRFLLYRRIGFTVALDPNLRTSVDIHDRDKLLILLEKGWIGIDYQDDGARHCELIMAQPTTT